uniref:Uncharacterized protein n=1 Tax=Arundo donax TaxID=35708 RepID=A0A0A8Z2L1_ARUDO
MQNFFSEFMIDMNNLFPFIHFYSSFHWSAWNI